MQGDIEAFPLLVRGHAKTDCAVDCLGDDICQYAAVNDRRARSYELKNQLRADPVLETDAAECFSVKTPVRMAPTNPPTPWTPNTSRESS